MVLCVVKETLCVELIMLCFEQMDVRGALGDLFQAQLKPLLP